MAAVRCPKCGTINDEGARSYPRCRRCQEHLLKCRYCERRLLDCDHPLRAEDSHVSDPDVYLACPHHRTTLRVGPAGKALALASSPPVLTALALSVIIAVAAYSLLAYYQRANEIVPARLTMRAVVRPAQAAVGQTVWIKIDILNTGRARAEHVTLYVDRAFVSAFTPVDLLPFTAQGSHILPTHFLTPEATFRS